MKRRNLLKAMLALPVAGKAIGSMLPEEEAIETLTKQKIKFVREPILRTRVFPDFYSVSNNVNCLVWIDQNGVATVTPTEVGKFSFDVTITKADGSEFTSYYVGEGKGRTIQLYDVT